MEFTENVHSYECEVNLPYPEVKANKSNKTYARILLKLFAGKVSEFSAASQYVYQNMVLEEEYPDAAAKLHCIGIVEMRHMDMLGDIIRQLGETPRFGHYMGDTFALWSARFVDYNTKIKRILLRDISDEHKAISAYEKAIEQIRDPQIDALLKRIIMDEEKHIVILNELMKKYT